MKLGVALPLIDVAVGGDPAAIREFAQAAEAIGYQDLSAPDHVLGVNVASRPDWGDRNTSADLFHDPFVLFGFLAGCTRNIEFSTQVLILAQRQAVLVAKQAASLDVLCGGRFRLGVGVGWNPVEFIGLNENFHNRGRRSEEQVEVMQALWAEPHVTFAGKYHTIEDAGINPRPAPARDPDLVRRPCRGDDAARRQMGRRLDAAQLRAGRRGGRGVRQTARDGRGGGTRSRQHRHRHARHCRDRRRGRVARDGALLEIVWRHPSDPRRPIRAAAICAASTAGRWPTISPPSSATGTRSPTWCSPSERTRRRLKEWPMQFRMSTLNLEQDHKRWDARRELIHAEIGLLKPDMMAFNEVCIPLQSARGLRDAATALTGIDYNLVQQTRVNGLSKVEGEALLTRFGIVETGNFDYQAKDIVALVVRVLVDGTPLDVYVTHLFMSRGDDSLRLFQVQQLLAWIDTRDDVAGSIVCGDFNATLDAPSAALMATRCRPTQREPTAFTPLADSDGSVSHPDRPRMDRCIDYIWVAGAIRIVDSGVCFNQPSSEDPSLWPSDHIGVWADLEFGG